MARQIVTQQAVNEVADALVTEGLDPSIMAVQSRIGGGSYSTVKRCLDAWKQERMSVGAGVADTPAAVQAKGQEFILTVWTLAAREAQREVQATKDEAKAQVAAVYADLTGATAEIARLESVESTQSATIESLQVKLREVELALAEAQAQARRVPELEGAMARLRLDLDACRNEATEKAVEAGRVAGEADALRAQLRELMLTIKPQP